jgi:hypothetical protein
MLYKEYRNNMYRLNVSNNPDTPRRQMAFAEAIDKRFGLLIN